MCHWIATFNIIIIQIEPIYGDSARHIKQLVFRIGYPCSGTGRPHLFLLLRNIAKLRPDISRPTVASEKSSRFSGVLVKVVLIDAHLLSSIS